MRLLRNDGCARRPQRDPRRVQLLIVEEGASSLGPNISGADFDEVIVLKQCQGESPSELLLRATGRLSSLERAGCRVGRAVISMAPLLHPKLAAVRRMLALAVLGHVQVAAQASELVLALDQNAAAELRSYVIALLESLVAHPGSRYAPIRVRFAPAVAVDVDECPACESGLHPLFAAAGTSGSMLNFGPVHP